MVKIHPLIPIAIGVLAILIGSMLFVANTYAAPFPVAVGGTGQSTITGSQVLYGAGTSPIQTVATGTVTCTGSASCGAGSYVLGNALTINSSGGSSAFASSSAFTAGQIPYATNTSGTPINLSAVSTSSLGVTGPITFSGTLGSQIGGSGGSFGCASCSTFTYPFPNQVGGGNATSSLTGFTGGLLATASSTIGAGGVTTGLTISGTASTTNFINTNVTSALALFDANHKEGSYGGSSGVCTNQFPTSLSALGALGTCTSVSDSFFSGQLAIAHGGTGSGSLTGDQILYTNHAGTAVLTVASSSLALPFSALPNVNANSVLGNGTNAAAAATSVATSSLFVAGNGISIGASLFQQKENRGFSYATSTAWTGTTTIPLGVGYGEVWNNIKCYTDAGTLNVDFYHASSHFITVGSFNASTTIGTITTQQNQTNTTGDKTSVDIGTPASSPTKVSCTVNDTN